MEKHPLGFRQFSTHAAPAARPGYDAARGVPGGRLPAAAGANVGCSAARGLESDMRSQALVSAVYGAVYWLGEVLGPVGGGLVTDQLGFPALATGLGAVTAAVCLAMTVRGLVYYVTTARGSVT